MSSGKGSPGFMVIMFEGGRPYAPSWLQWEQTPTELMVEIMSQYNHDDYKILKHSLTNKGFNIKVYDYGEVRNYQYILIPFGEKEFIREVGFLEGYKILSNKMHGVKHLFSFSIGVSGTMRIPV